MGYAAYLLTQEGGAREPARSTTLNSEDLGVEVIQFHTGATPFVLCTPRRSRRHAAARIDSGGERAAGVTARRRLPPPRHSCGCVTVNTTVAGTRPRVRQVAPLGIPDDLQPRQQWVAWRLVAAPACRTSPRANRARINTVSANRQRAGTRELCGATILGDTRLAPCPSRTFRYR